MVDMLVIEIARLFFSGISAAASAIGVWQKSRDKKKAAETFDNKFNETKASKEAEVAALELVNIIPDDVIKDLEARADNCWTGFRKVLGGDFLPDEVDKATLSVKACVCRELKRIKELNGSIPERWKNQWDQYKCEGKGLSFSPAAHPVSPETEIKPLPQY